MNRGGYRGTNRNSYYGQNARYNNELTQEVKEMEDRIRRLETGLMQLALNQNNHGQNEKRFAFFHNSKPRLHLPKYKVRFETQLKRVDGQYQKLKECKPDSDKPQEYDHGKDQQLEVETLKEQQLEEKVIEEKLAPEKQCA